MSTTYSVLIIDDEAGQRTVLAGHLRKKGYSVLEAASAGEAEGVLKRGAVDIVLTDLRMPGKSGLDLLKEVRSDFPETAVIIMTAFGTIEGAVEAMREGAYDYLLKPIDLAELDIRMQRIRERRLLLSENRLLKEQLERKYSFAGFIAESPEMEQVLSTAVRVAQSNASILIRGESGTGKELVARAIHFNSLRKDGPFVAVNCAALNENLLESELFGHERGAFTGAERQRHGRFELADSGTIFLDEIGDIAPSIQVKLLRVLQERQFERVGGTDPVRIDVRVIAATNRNLEERIAGGAFREDLLYRLNVVTIEIPPLRKRRSDIAPTLEHFLKSFAQEQQRTHLAFSHEAWNQLLRYDYPGNVRELQNIVQRAVILSRGETIITDDLPQVVREMKRESTLPHNGHSLSLPERVDTLEKELVFEALRLHGGSQTKAAGALGISERNLRYRLKKWDVKP